MSGLMRALRDPLRVLLLVGMQLAGTYFVARADDATLVKLPGPAPTLAAVVPAGLARGTAVESVLVGTNLEQLTAVRVTGEGVTADLIPLAEGKKANPRQTSIKITASADALPGPRELRLVTASGVSNVVRFQVGTMPEMLEREPNDQPTAANVIESLPAVANGTLDRGEDRDHYGFAARAGQTLIIDFCGQQLHPYVANQRPGWLEGFLSVREAPEQVAANDSPSRPLAYSYDFPGREDPLLVFAPPRDGMYVVEVRDDLYRGRPEFNYRLTIGEIPYVTAVFPAGGKRGESVPVALEGFNLRDLKSLSITAPAAEPLGTRWERAAGNHANAFRWEVGDANEVIEAEPNDLPSVATSIAAGAPATTVVANGIIERNGDVDFYRFTAAKGQRLIIETTSRSLGSPLDARLELLDAAGRRLKESDDANNAFDAQLDHLFAADGEYLARVTDTTGIGSRRHVYRLSVRTPRPDFTLTVSPDNPRVTAGAAAVMKVRVQRRDGFAGDIELGVDGAPANSVIGPAAVVNGLTEYTLSVTLAADTPAGVVPLMVWGKAKIGDDEVTRRAVPAEAIRYVNDLRYIPVNDLVLSVLPPAPISLAWGVADVNLVAGETVSVPVRVERASGFTAPVKLLIEGLPPRIVSPPVTIEENTSEAMVELRSSKGVVALETSMIAMGAVTHDGVSFTQSSPALRLRVTAPPASEGKK